MAEGKKKCNQWRKNPLWTHEVRALAYIIVPGWRFLPFGYVNCNIQLLNDGQWSWTVSMNITVDFMSHTQSHKSTNTVRERERYDGNNKPCPWGRSIVTSNKKISTHLKSLIQQTLISKQVHQEHSPNWLSQWWVFFFFFLFFFVFVFFFLFLFLFFCFCFFVFFFFFFF